MKTFISTLCLLLSISGIAQTIFLAESNSESSFRGLSVVNDNVIWVSGSNGTVCVSINGGKDFTALTVKGYEKSDFRSIHVFSEKEAVIASVGTPGYVLRTDDGGQSWKKVHEDSGEGVFIDGMDFWNMNEGIIYGDPVDGKMYMYRTYDGGKSWKEVPASQRPDLEVGEASFAASGTGIRCLGNDAAVIATGGMKSRIFVTTNQGNDWFPIETPVTQGESTRGIYSIAWSLRGKAVIVGGDYTQMEFSENHVFYSDQNLQEWIYPETPTRGYRECVEFIDDNTLIAVGPTGVDITADGGKTWKALSNEKGFHTARKARNGKIFVFAGAEGKIGILVD